MSVYVPDPRDDETREREYRAWLAENDSIDDVTRAWVAAWAAETQRRQLDEPLRLTSSS